MKALHALLIVTVLLTTSALSQEKPKLPSRQDLLKAVESFSNAPLSARGKAAAATIVRFAEESHDVVIVISPKVVPWIGGDEQRKFSETLLAAYLAGNVKSQLERRTKANDSYAGIQQVLKTYAQLKEADKTLKIPEIQKFIDLEAKQQLKQYVDDALRKDEKEPAK